MVGNSYLGSIYREAIEATELKEKLFRFVIMFFFLGMICLFIIGGAWCLKRSLADSFRNRAAESWPRASGKIMESRVEASGSTSGDARETYSPVVNIRYQVGDQWFSCRNIYFGYGTTSDQCQVFVDTQQFEPGNRAMVHYNPANPSESILKPGYHKSNTLFIVIGSIMLGVGILMAVPLLFGKAKDDPKPQSLNW